MTTNQENKTIFYYLLDVITQRKEIIPSETLPEENKKDINYCVWMLKLDFSEDSQIQASLRSSLQKQSELMSNAGKIKIMEHAPLKKEEKKLSIGALIGIIAGGISLLTATLVIIFQKLKKEAAGKQTV